MNKTDLTLELLLHKFLHSPDVFSKTLTTVYHLFLPLTNSNPLESESELRLYRGKDYHDSFKGYLQLIQIDLYFECYCYL